MKTFEKEIDDLFNSTGFFPNEYTNLLDKLNLEDQRIFFTELYKRVTSDEYKRHQGNEGFGVNIVKDKRVYHFSKDDMILAKKSTPCVGEALLKGMGADENECLKYRATFVFHERKRREIEFEASSIAKLFKSITTREKSNISFESLIDKDSIYKNIDFEFLVFPSKFNKDALLEFLKKEDFKTCFNLPEHYQHFKSNSFMSLAERKKPRVLNIPLDQGKKRILAKKLYKLYSKFESQNKDYSELDLTKSAYAKILMCNFSEFRKNLGNNASFETTLSNVYKQIRK